MIYKCDDDETQCQLHQVHLNVYPGKAVTFQMNALCTNQENTKNVDCMCCSKNTVQGIEFSSDR